MNQKLIKLWDNLNPYKSIIYFLFLLFFFHFSWKILIGGDIEDNYMLFLGKDITPDWFYTARVWLTKAAAWFVRLFPDTDHLIVTDTYLYFPNDIKISIVWGCTGLKQLLIFSGIMIFYRCFVLIKKPDDDGYKVQFLPFWDKLWYIPMGWIILTTYNVMRIGGIVLLTHGHRERFEFLHDGLFRYIYYGIIFLLWVIWEEVYVNKVFKHENYRKIAVAS